MVSPCTLVPRAGLAVSVLTSLLDCLTFDSRRYGRVIQSFRRCRMVLRSNYPEGHLRSLKTDCSVANKFICRATRSRTEHCMPVWSNLYRIFIMTIQSPATEIQSQGGSARVTTGIWTKAYMGSHGCRCFSDSAPACLPS